MGRSISFYHRAEVDLWQIKTAKVERKVLTVRFKDGTKMYTFSREDEAIDVYDRIMEFLKKRFQDD